MPISFNNIQLAFEIADMEGGGSIRVILDRESGNAYQDSGGLFDGDDELPDDIDDGERYVEIPDKKSLGLGKPLVMRFAREFMPDDFDDVRAIFSRRGAYARFKVLIARRGLIDTWHKFFDTAKEAAIREWCAENEIELSD